ncbi:hypothetical protein D3C87_1973980 [compost metagenome]
MAQTIPLSVTVAPPSAVTFPPRVAFVAPTPEAAAVVTVGAVAAGVENRRKLSMANSALAPFVKQFKRISKVVPVPVILAVNSLKA